MGLMIGELAKKVGVNIETVRYYERRGLLLPTSKMESGYRLYNKEALKHLEFIRYSKKLGFTLKETEELLRLRISPKARSDNIREKVKSKLCEIDNRIKGLQTMRKVLNKLIKDCCAGQPTEKCPILRTIDKKGRKN